VARISAEPSPDHSAYVASLSSDVTPCSVPALGVQPTPEEVADGRSVVIEPIGLAPSHERTSYSACDWVA
jgi:hypothetical protein